MKSLLPDGIEAIVHGSAVHAPPTEVGVNAGVVVSVTRMLVATDGPRLLTVIT